MSVHNVITDVVDNVADSRLIDWHMSRSWKGMGTPREDACPCPQEPCGHVATSKVVAGCPEHDLSAAKTMRSTHRPKDCPGAPA